MFVDVGQRLTVPSHIVTTTLRPDLTFWSNVVRVVNCVELTVLWEDAVDEVIGPHSQTVCIHLCVFKPCV